MTKSQQAILALIIANIIWGAAAPIFKWSLENIQPFTLAFLRFAIASCLLLPFACKSLSIKKKDIIKIFFMAFFGITINISFFFLALKHTASINAPIIASSAPIFIVLSSMLFLKERPKAKTFIGTSIGLLGVMLLVVKPIFENGIDASVGGNLLLIVATIGGIIHLLIAKEISNTYSPITLAFYSFFIGTLTFTPLFLSETSSVGFLPNLNIQGIVGILFGSLLSSLLAYYLFYWAMKYVMASEVGLFAYIDPIVALLIAIPLLGEIPTLTYFIAAFFVFLGIYIAEGRIHYHPFHRLKLG